MTTRKPSMKPLARAPIDPPGTLYRVRDRHMDLGDGDPLPGHVWGEGLTLAEANKLKDQVVGARKSRTARIEPMDVPMPGSATPDGAPAADEPQEIATETSPAISSDLSALDPDGLYDVLDDAVVEFDLADALEHEVPTDGIVRSVPSKHELLVNGMVCVAPVHVVAGDKIVARPVDAQIAAARAQATASARQERTARPAYRDRTVVPQKPRKGPAPKDKTVPKTPRVVRLGAPPVAPPVPLPSPLKVATIPDGDPLPDDAITDSDLPDLDVGGGPSDADVQHAERMRDLQKQPGA